MRRPLLLASLATFLLVAPALARDGFLSDGGGIRTERVVGTPYGPAVIEVPALGEGRPFLQDGGGIRFAPELPRYDAGRGYAHGGNWRQSSPSVIEVPDGSTQSAASGAISVVVINGPTSANGEARQEPTGYGGPKIIQVASARLDRRPFDASGIDIVRSGATKIIRIAPTRHGMREQPEADGSVEDETLELEDASGLASLPSSPVGEMEQRSPVPSQNGMASRNGTTEPEKVPDAVMPPEPAVADVGDDLEPWTEAWRTDCVRRHANFDPSLGTYRDEEGRRRFCTAEN